MLFDFGETIIDSEKERNFYIKFFAGYLFNELIPGFQERVNRFVLLLNRSDRINHSDQQLNVSPFDLHMTFDLHRYLFNKETDRGELADIAIVDEKSSTCICIEAKWFEDWSYHKDVLSNRNRIEKCLKSKYSNICQCLLVKQSKWEFNVQKSKAPGSNYAALKFQSDKAPIILFWEDLFSIVDDQSVKSFFNHHINRRKVDFRNYQIQL